MSFPSLLVMPVANVETASETYRTLLGVDPYVEGPYYAGFRVGDSEIGLDPNGSSLGIPGALPYWDVDDLAAAIERLVTAGASIARPPTEVGGGITIAVLTDGDGNPIGLRQSS